jgi:ubiquitin-protein ligase E3 C
LEYIERVSNHLLVKRLRPQSDAFKKGLAEVIDLEHLAIFNEAELQVLISGAPTAIDVVDLKQHCRLAGGFTSMDRTVQRFWKVVASLDAREQALLLRFVTSCQRPPPLGFEQLQPPFCLQRIPVSSDDEKLPSAATCFNTLKLPTYSSEKVMKKKLLVSITSNSGFELT